MVEQMIVITDRAEEVNSWLRKGWIVKAVDPLYITSGEHSFTAHGKCSYVLQKTKA
jgi:hypothetical protein